MSEFPNPCPGGGCRTYDGNTDIDQVVCPTCGREVFTIGGRLTDHSRPTVYKGTPGEIILSIIDEVEREMAAQT